MLQLEGRIVGAWVGELREACDLCIEHEAGSLRLNLTDVDFADREGVALLSALRASGVELAGCSPFLEEQLKAASMNKQQNSTSAPDA